MIPSHTLLTSLSHLELPDTPSAGQCGSSKVATFPPSVALAPASFSDALHTSPYTLTNHSTTYFTDRPVSTQRAATSFTSRRLLDDARGRSGRALFLARTVQGDTVDRLEDRRRRIFDQVANAAAADVPPAPRLKRARSDSPPPSQLNSVAFPSSEHSSPTSAPERKRGRVGSLLPLTDIGEEAEEDERETECPSQQRERLLSHSFTLPARTQIQRKSRRQRLYARQFPARSFIPRLDSITEAEVEELIMASAAAVLEAAVRLDVISNSLRSHDIVTVHPVAVCRGRRQSFLKPLRMAIRVLRRSGVLPSR